MTSPNLEQCGLLHFDDLAIDELAADQAYWQEKNAHGVLVAASTEQRVPLSLPATQASPDKLGYIPRSEGETCSLWAKQEDAVQFQV